MPVCPVFYLKNLLCNFFKKLEEAKVPEGYLIKDSSTAYVYYEANRKTEASGHLPANTKKLGLAEFYLLHLVRQRWKRRVQFRGCGEILAERKTAPAEFEMISEIQIQVEVMMNGTTITDPADVLSGDHVKGYAVTDVFQRSEMSLSKITPGGNALTGA